MQGTRQQGSIGEKPPYLYLCAIVVTRGNPRKVTSVWEMGRRVTGVTERGRGAVSESPQVVKMSTRDTSTKKAPVIPEPSQHQILMFLQRPYVLGLQALRSLRNLEFHALPFLQAAETARLDRREVHEDILATLAADETISLGFVKLLYASLFNTLVQIPFSEFLRWKESEGTAGQVLAVKLVAAHNRF